MANYYDSCSMEVADPVGLGTGHTAEGEDRICIYLHGRKLTDGEQGWTALPPAAAKELFELLDMVRHLFEEPKGGV